MVSKLASIPLHHQISERRESMHSCEILTKYGKIVFALISLDIPKWEQSPTDMQSEATTVKTALKATPSLDLIISTFLTEK